MTDDRQNKVSDGHVDTLAEEIVNTINRSGGKAWLGLPPESEFRAVNDDRLQREIDTVTRRDAKLQRDLAQLKQRALKTIRKTTHD